MKFHQIWAATLCTGTLLTLQGCGGGGGGDDVKTTTTTSSTAPGPSTTTTVGWTTTTTVGPTTTTTTMTAGPTTTTTTFPRSPPLTGMDAVEYFNSNYKAWDQKDQDSPVGVVMRTAGEWGFFCEGFKSYVGCFNGHNQCTTSASILNNRVMLNNKDQLFMGLDRPTAIMFNTSMMETKLGRCTYQYDGGTFGRYNRGCGGQAQIGKGMCKDTKSAWFDIDPKTGQETTDDSQAVLEDYCPNRKAPPTQKEDTPCYWKGPAWSKTGITTKSETRKMMSQRITNQGDNGGLVSTWNEVVIDARLLLPELHRDPATVVLAMVYEDNGDVTKVGEAKKVAAKMAKAMQEEFNMDQPVPIVGVDTRLHMLAQPDVPGPFFSGEHWSTQTTTTTPRTGPACCQDGCSGHDCNGKENWCGESEANCEGCKGEWCPATLMAAFLM